MAEKAMEFGIFSNNRRFERTLADAWDRDIFEIVTADKLGFQEAWRAFQRLTAPMQINNRPRSIESGGRFIKG